MRGELHWLRALVGSLLIAILIMGWAFWLNQQRMMDFDTGSLSVCERFPDTASLAACARWQLMSHMAEPHWLARLFVYYFLPSLLFAWLWLRRSSRPGIESLAVSLLASMWVFLTFEPPWLLICSISAGFLMAGLAILRWRHN